MGESYAVAGVAKARPGMRDRLADGLIDIARRARTEDGNVEFRVHQDRGDETVVFFYELWRSEQDAQVHLGQPYMAEFMESARDLLDGELEVRILSLREE